MDRTITSTSGRPGAGSLEKWSMALKPFLSYTVTGEMVPARDKLITRIKAWIPLPSEGEQERRDKEQQKGKFRQTFTSFGKLTDQVAHSP